MGIDINGLRADRGGDPEKIKKSEESRFRDPKVVDKLIAHDRTWREQLYHFEGLRGLQNKLSKEIAARKSKDKSDACVSEREQIESVKKEIAEAERISEATGKELRELLGSVGNVVHESVPVFEDEANNTVLRKWGIPKVIVPGGDNAWMLKHHQLLAAIGGFDPKRGAAIAGHRGYFLRSVGVMLNQALINYGMQFLVERGYDLVQPPFFMKRDVMSRTAELKDFEDTLYRIPGEQSGDKPEDGTPDSFLIATSEQPISAMHMNEWLEPESLPRMYGGISTCFRKEAGSAGKEAQGIFRVHQFEKVEQFCISTPEKSWEMHEQMIGLSEGFYQSLELPYRVIAIVSGALNDAAAKKYDLEAWFPSFNDYRELVSCSNCTDFQSRELEIRCGQKKHSDREKRYVHLLNGTLCATQRCMCCILENFQTPAGVQVPRVLVPFMAGQEFIPFVNTTTTTT